MELRNVEYPFAELLQYCLQIVEINNQPLFIFCTASIYTTSRRLADRKSEKFQKNITRRGSVPETTVKKGADYPVGPILLGFFVFVVIGSCKILYSQAILELLLFTSFAYFSNAISSHLLPALFQIIRTATSGGMA
ncbi:hypothetical protein KSS87_018732 [Heliosperma pusillum]|nr:hypothetical protein KSS87_018732 [Heliosperma pusillum]